MKKFISSLLFVPCLIFAQSLPDSIEVSKAISETLIGKQFKNDPANVTKYILDNGLTVYLSENHELPQVFGLVMTKAGGKNDPKDATGLAHYLEHMLFKGTKTMGTIDYELEKPHLDSINDLYDELGKTKEDSLRMKIQKQINDVSLRAAKYAIPNEIDKILAEIGATGVNAFTSEEMTVYHNTFPSNQMNKWLDIYSHRFEEPVFRLFQSELETVYEEKNRSNDNPGYKAFEVFLENFYKNHPYGQQPLIGFTEHLKNPPLKRMYEYFDTYYVANNMSLVLAGDFDSKKVIKEIEKKFGDWRTGEVPVFPEYKEEPFNGREHLEVKFTPIKIGIMGYRTSPSGSEDQAVVDVINNMLTNSASSGLVDQATTNGELMFGQVQPMNYNDHGATLIIFAPKLVGQKFAEAENVLKQKFEILKSGEFTDEFLNATKQNMINDIKYGWEDNYTRALEIAQAFSEGTEWGDYVKMVDRINSITKEDVIAAAKKYFGKNYLILESGMGKPEKENLDKPPFQAIENKNEVKSEYYEAYSKIPTNKVELKPIIFNESIESIEVGKGISLRKVSNPHNELFELSIRFGNGSYYNPRLKYLAEYFNYAGTEQYPGSEFKVALFNLGSKVYVSTSENEFIFTIEGTNENLEATLKLLNEMIANPEVNQDQLDKVVNDTEANKKFELDNPQYLSEVLKSYALYGKRSSFLNDLSIKDLKKLKVEALISDLREVLNYEVDIDYIGNTDISTVKDLVKSSIEFSSEARKTAQPDVVLKMNLDSIVYILNKKGAVQSQLNFIIAMDQFDPALVDEVNAFNEYFGKNMSSLVFQEIREFRSLAYSAYGVVREPSTKDGYYHFSGYIGCQADKTNDALDAMYVLLKDMPEKSERMDIIKSSLTNEAIGSQPGFRDLLYEVEDWQHMGYSADPRVHLLQNYKNMTFEEIVAFYNKHISKSQVIYTVVGDSKRFDQKALEKYGNIQVVKLKDIMVD